MNWIRRGGGVAWVLVAAGILFGAAPAPAVSVSPRILESARRSPEEAEALRAKLARHEAFRSQGVDRVYPRFALDMAKYPRGGVAHRSLLVVLAQFPAEGPAPARYPHKSSTPGYYHRLFFSDDPDDDIVSLREYFKINSHGRLIVTGAVTSKWLTMPHSYRYYANGASGLDFSSYPRSSQRLAEDAMAAAFGEFRDRISAFDNDGPDGVAGSGDDDGYVDAVMVIHPGRPGEIVPGAASNDTLWSHEAGIAQYTGCDPVQLQSSPDCVPGIQLGGVRGFLYVMGGEYNDYPGDGSMGTYAHEFGHTLGLPDLYDPNAAGLGFFSLMALGNYLPYNDPGRALGSRPSSLDAWCRQFLGFDAVDIPTVEGPYTLAPVTRGGGSLRVWSNGEPKTEYFLLEHRRREGPDAFLPGDGLLVYHVDDTQVDNLSGYPNYRVRLVQADSLNPLQLESTDGMYGNFGDDRDPFPGSLGKRSITGSTSPSTDDLAGNDTGVRIWNIVAGSIDGADTASFDLALSTAPQLRMHRVAMSDGGGDGYPDPGETLDATVTLRNVGLASGPLTLTLSTLDPFVTVTTAASSAPAIPAGGTGTTATPFQLTIGSPPALPHDALLTVAWTDGSSAGSVSFPITIGMGSGLAEDFESGAFGWTHAPIPPSASDQWHVSTSRAHAGTASMKLGSTNPLGTGSNEAQTYASDQDAALVSPAFDLPAGSELVFWSYIDAETNGGTGAWDGGRVEISVNGGDWVPLAVDGGYGSIIEFNSSAALRGSDAFSGSPKRWRRVVADLTPYSGAARIRFRFASDEANDPRLSTGAQIRYYEGWYVDDVSVQGRTGGGPTPRLITFRAGPNPFRVGGASSGSIQFRFSAPDGLPQPGLRPDVRVFDVRGRQVGRVTATANPLAPAEFIALWDPSVDSGEPIGSGIYFATVDVLGRSQTARLVLIR